MNLFREIIYLLAVATSFLFGCLSHKDAQEADKKAKETVELAQGWKKLAYDATATAKEWEDEAREWKQMALKNEQRKISAVK
jgi:hypothetical protein